jgi:hypothetical protein
VKAWNVGSNGPIELDETSSLKGKELCCEKKLLAFTQRRNKVEIQFTRKCNFSVNYFLRAFVVNED